MTLHLGLSHGHQRSTQQQQEIREARRMLRDKVRDDWDYPALPRYQTRKPVPRRAAEEGNRIAGFKFHHTASSLDKDPLIDGTPLRELGFEPTEWREREYSSGEEWSEEHNDGEELSTRTGSQSSGRKKGISSNSMSNKSREAHPPSDLGQARERKRQKRLEEELAWNDGLAHWMTRRDKWCAAHTSAEVDALHTTRISSPSTETVASSTASTSTSTSSTPESHASNTTPGSSTSSSLPTTPTTPNHSSMPNTSTSIPTMLLPIPPPLLPTTHPIRTRIKPPLYPEIYTKIIQQARSPSVPINLRVLISALVQGWKDDGEWPPKSAVVEGSTGAGVRGAEERVGRRRRGRKGEGLEGTGGKSRVMCGVKAVGRVLRIGSGAEGHAGGGGAIAEEAGV